MGSLTDRAREAAENPPETSEWGYKLTLDPGASWEGRWRGEATGRGEYGDRRVFLFWDRDGAQCFADARSRLAAQVDADYPTVGDNVALWRGDDEYRNGRTIHKLGIARESNPEPLPEPPEEETPAPVPVQTDFGEEPPW